MYGLGGESRWLSSGDEVTMLSNVDLVERSPLTLCSLAADATPSVKSPIGSQGPSGASTSTRPSLIRVHHIRGGELTDKTHSVGEVESPTTVEYGTSILYPLPACEMYQPKYRPDELAYTIRSGVEDDGADWSDGRDVRFLTHEPRTRLLAGIMTTAEGGWGRARTDDDRRGVEKVGDGSGEGEFIWRGASMNWGRKQGGVSLSPANQATEADIPRRD